MSIKSFILNNKRMVLVAGGVASAVAIWAAFAIFGVHTLFIDKTANEAAPFQAGPGISGIAGDETSEDMAQEMNAAMAESGKPMKEMVDEDPMMSSEATILARGEFIDRSYETTGTALVLTDGKARVLRIENLKTSNGPQLNVYLSKSPPDAPAKDFGRDAIDLGTLKGNIGNQNYEIGPDVNLDEYTTVVIWCVRFSTAFGTAGLT